MSDYGIGELAIETSMVIHIEQITGGADADCHCGETAVLHVTTLPDMDPGPVCADHAWQWINMTTRMLSDMFPSGSTP